MRRTLRVGGWVLLALAVVSVTTIVTVGAMRAHSAAGFNQWVGWATVAAVPLAALGILLVVLDKISGSKTVPKLGSETIEDQIARVILKQSGELRSRLIGTDEVGDRPANTRFFKIVGRFREVGGKGEGDLSTVLAYYQSLSPRRLVVLGDPGSGKTVLAIELLIQLLEHRRHDKDTPIPVLLSAAAYDASLGWEKWLAAQLALRFNIDNAAAARLVGSRQILPIVDGVDEMDPVGEPERAQLLIRELNAWIQGSERAPVVVTCRRAEYRDLLRQIDRATHIELAPLTGEEAAGYLRDQFLSADEELRWSRVLATLHEYPGGALAMQLATPWRLTMALAAFRNGDDPAELLPIRPVLTDVATQEYARHLDRLLLGRYVPSAVRLHAPPGGYTEQQVQRWLTALADGLTWQVRHNGSATDIQLNQWWRPVGQWISRSIHMALVAVPGLAILAVGIATRNAFMTGLGAGCLVMVPVSSLAPTLGRLKVREIFTPRGLLRFAVGFAVGFALGFVLMDNSVGGYNLLAELVLGFTIGFLMGFTDESPQAIGPRDIIHADGRYGLTVGSFVGATLAIILAIKFGFSQGVVGGIAVGVALTLGATADTWVRYHICVVILAIHQWGPLRFGAFLDWAQQAGLLRVSGVAYQFRHRQLQDWLRPPINAESATL